MCLRNKLEHEAVQMKVYNMCSLEKFANSKIFLKLKPRKNIPIYSKVPFHFYFIVFM